MKLFLQIGVDTSIIVSLNLRLICNYTNTYLNRKHLEKTDQVLTYKIIIVMRYIKPSRILFL